MNCLLSCDRALENPERVHPQSRRRRSLSRFSSAPEKYRTCLGESSGEAHEGTQQSRLRGETHMAQIHLTFFSAPESATPDCSTRGGGTAFLWIAREDP